MKIITYFIFIIIIINVFTGLKKKNNYIIIKKAYKSIF